MSDDRRQRESQALDYFARGGQSSAWWSRRIEFGKIGKFDRICGPRTRAALVWRDGGGLVYLVVRLPWYSRRGFEIVPPGWCWRFVCLRIRWRWPTFKRSGWLEPWEVRR